THTLTATSFPHKENPAVEEHTNTNTKSYSHIMLNEETISRFLKIEQQAEFFEQFSADEITFSNIKKPALDFSKILNKNLDSRSPRHELKIEVLLISPRGKTFRTHSKNISLSGCLLEDTMPFEFYDNVFDIVIMSSLNKDPKKARVKMQGKAVVASGTRSQRLQYHNPTSEQKTNLQNLLEEYLQSTKAVTSTTTTVTSTNKKAA
ncbi:MAG: PilZ domain-containing protein, partial [Pseudobdellovibrio sp.]